jgi:hypothetical protein
VRPAVESPRNAGVALQVAFTLANLANGHTQRQAFVLAHGQLLCSLRGALVDVTAEARCAGLGAVIEVACGAAELLVAEIETLRHVQVAGGPWEASLTVRLTLAVSLFGVDDSFS